MAKRIISLMMVAVLSMSMFMLVGCNGFDLSNYKEQKKTEIETYATSKGEENYYEAEWQEILGIVNSAKTEIDALEDKNAVDAKVTLVKEVIDNVITKEQLLAYKTQAKTELENYATNKSEEKYNEAEWQEILSIVNSAKTEIDALEDKNTVDEKVTLVKEVIDNVITKEQLLAYKTQAKTELENYAVAKGEENYNEVAWGEINSIVESAKTEIDTVLAKNLVDEKVTIAKERIDGMLTNEELEEYKTAAILEIDEYYKTVYPEDFCTFSQLFDHIKLYIREFKQKVKESFTKGCVDKEKEYLQEEISFYRRNYGLIREIDDVYKDGGLSTEDLKDIAYYYFKETVGKTEIKLWDKVQKEYIEHTPRAKTPEKIDYRTMRNLDRHLASFFIFEFNAYDYTIKEERFTYLGTYNEHVVFYLDHDLPGAGSIEYYSDLPIELEDFTTSEGIFVYSK